ncbi:MAG: hypothetical protein WAX89_02560 [Alphaproteobacteria bacterium]
MGFKKMQNKFLWVLVFASLSLSVHAQEVLWSVDNSDESEIVPLYEGQNNPFFTYAKPPEVKAQEVEEAKDAAELERQRINNAAGQILQRIRAQLDSGQFSSPQVYGLKIDGYLKSATGEPKVLIKNEWKGVGDLISVATQVADKVSGLLAELSVYSPTAAEKMADEVEEKVKFINSYELRLYKINSQQIELKDSEGKIFVIAYSQN